MPFRPVIASSRFIWRCTRATPTYADREIRLELPNGQYVRADVYQPDGPIFGTILSIHGMSPRAWRDPRLCVVNRGFAEAGFRTISPLVESIARLRIRPEQVDEVEDITSATIRQVTNSSPLGLFSVSFSGAITLLAAGRPSVASHIRALLALGTFADPERTLGSLFRTDDEYGRLLALANVLELARGDDDPVAAGLYRAALDVFYEDEAPALPGLTSRMDQAAALELDRLLNRADARESVWQRHRSLVAPLLERLTIDSSHLHSVAGRITLVHGRADPIIDSAETVALAETLRAAGRSPRTLLTPLLGHGDPELHLRDLLEAPALIGAFADFFSDLANAR